MVDHSQFHVHPPGELLCPPYAQYDPFQDITLMSARLASKGAGLHVVGASRQACILVWRVGGQWQNTSRLASGSWSLHYSFQHGPVLHGFSGSAEPSKLAAMQHVHVFEVGLV